MQIPKDLVIQFILSKIGAGPADQARQELPDQVDTEKDAGLLSRFGVDPKDLGGLLGGSGGGGLGGLLGGSGGGGLGGLGGKLGL